MQFKFICIHNLNSYFFTSYPKSKTIRILNLSMPTAAASDSPSANNLDDYSASSTVITFDRPIPLLRGPLPAGPSDQPSLGPNVLAFRDARAWASAYRSCELKIVQQCEEGARIGCAISSSSRCKPPWWKALLGSKPSDLKERELCEEREMANCFAEAKEKCVEFAKDKCLVPFRDARIRVKERGFDSKRAVRLIHWASVPERTLRVISALGFDAELGVTNRRAGELVRYDDCVKCILGEQEQSVEN
ncbi:hypothetical protein HN51_015460 [Arachis hypogaea]|uniref:Uncharacterized protein LOC107493170 n=1 Tax=Arachis duranensis TaxID=130453 RepID=A0A6P5NY61_ARADU|nr:uncharacterized protein LOC107493170 [Arachis duranensis]XP_020999799.1 uncharacterized protein LOC107493170 [Arachis duranensis]XP_020999800.1 uncharacterized protein LOC107493170 [Arachis duranensis]XP_020999801.1 uncharacterized protein LOC107493170 [Arachis duranensis]XP_025604692.1 uncharacterized protein LOC112696251 [Arachis hypogaea]XP_052119203.1 uncharacterized protein LOC107493170 [Arachis duranensis]XP_052119204.1 uncharacterized protein LOC107493170 [Arachis duranensis]XP_052